MFGVRLTSYGDLARKNGLPLVVVSQTRYSRCMQIVAIVENGIIRLPAGVHLPDGMHVTLDIPAAPTGDWPPGYFESNAGALAGEPFERPPQGEFEKRTEW